MNNPTVATSNLRAKWLHELREEFKERPAEQVIFSSSDSTGDLLLRQRVYGKGVGSELVSAGANATESSEGVSSHKGLRAWRGVKEPRVQLVTASSRDRYILLRKYEGFVTGRAGESFAARLFENTSDYPVMDAEFSLEEVSETDRAAVVEGAAIVWTIGYRYEGNTQKRESLIYVRRLPEWHPGEVEAAKNIAEELTRGIDWK